MPKVDPPPRVYARHLLPLGYGYPLWTPEPGAQFLRYRRDGLRIGDVGVIVPENGSFDVFFNICLSRDHPFHRVNGVPDNFMPIRLDDLDVGIFPHAENPGRVISTSSVTTVRKVASEPSAGTGHQGAWNYEFNLSSSEGALLILPHGAESYSLLKKELFSDVATQHGIEWYNFAEQRLGRIIRHDSLYLITGFHKSRSWSVTALHEATGTTTEFPAQFKADGVRDGNISTAYAWETMRALHWRAGPLDDWGISNQAVFITGFKIAVRDNILGNKWVEVEVDAPSAQPRPTKFSSGSQGRSSFARFWKRVVPKGGQGRGATDQGEDPEASSSSIPNDASNSRHVTVSHVPQAPQSIHPSDIVNRYLLRKDPNAIVSILHDSQWNILLEKGLLQPEDLEDEGRLENVMSENYRLVSRDGVVSLKCISDISIRVTDLDDAACQAWKADKLIDAEEILSKRIIQTAGSNHCVFANRAPLRARLQQWNAALRDAEMSIAIQSSVIGYIAKGFALFGLEKYGSATQALNLAIRDCDVPDKDFVLLVKSVVLFETKYHAESMACISDLLEHCPIDIKSAGVSIQAQMYLTLTAFAMKNEDSERALQLSEKARSLGPFDEIMDLSLILLVSGWKFDNLQFTVYQRHCEVLYVAGKFKEAAIALETMMKDLGEDVKARKNNADWLNKFRYQCLNSLESIGDAAMWSADYSEAITQYSAALNMNPNMREGILVKRSKAHIGMRAWDDALNDANEAITLSPISPWCYEIKYNALRGMQRYEEAIKAFSDMISNLEPSIRMPSYPSKLQPMVGHVNRSRATAVLQNSQPLRRLDHSSIVESVLVAAQDADPRPAANMLDMLRAERDEMVQGTSRTITGRQSGTPGESNVPNEEFPSVVVLPDEEVRRKMNIEERDQKLRDELTALVRQNPEEDQQVPELMKMVLRLADQAVVKPHRNDTIEEPSVQELLEELQMHNTKQREVLEALSDHWKNDNSGEQEHDNNQAPRTFRTLREEVRNLLRDEVQEAMGEIISFGAERRRMQQEVGQLMTLQSKYGPGGEFDPGWKPPRRMLPPKVPPPPDTPQIPKRPTGRSKKGTKPPVPAGPGKGLAGRPGWHSVAHVRSEPPPPIVPPERDFFGLFGLLTPIETTIELLPVEAGPALESESASLQLPSPQQTYPKADVKKGSSLPENSLLLRFERDASMLLSPPQSLSKEQLEAHWQLVPSPPSPTTPSEFTQDFKGHPTSGPKIDPGNTQAGFIDT